MAVFQTWGSAGPAVTQVPVSLVFRAPSGPQFPQENEGIARGLKGSPPLLRGSLFGDVKEGGRRQSPGSRLGPRKDKRSPSQSCPAAGRLP